MWEKPKILVVDDEEVNLVLMEAILVPAGYQVILARSGEEALAAAVREEPDAILLDVMMPKIDGFTVCRQLKEGEATRFIPVIIITALDRWEDRVQGLAAGADDFLTKPVNEIELKVRLRSLLRIKKLNDQLRYAHEHINYLTRHVDDLLKHFDPLSFLTHPAREELIKQLFYFQKLAPEMVLVAFLEGDEKGQGAIYFLQEGRVHQERFSFSLLPQSPLAKILTLEGRSSWGNRSEGQEEIFRSLEGILAQAKVRRTLHNYVSYRQDSIWLCCFNYAHPVTSYECDVLRNLSTYSQFLELIAEQVKRTEEAFHYTLEALARAAEANDEDTGNHIIRVGVFAKELAEAMGCPRSFCQEIGRAAKVHDVGKVHIPSHILRKPGKLSPEEWEIIRQHPYYGARILGEAPRLKTARDIALHHHEKWDGSGYPQGLKGEEISLAGRIVALADIYDALRNKRSYKPAFSHEEVFKIITSGDGRVEPSHFDPYVLETFRKIAPRFEEIYESLKD
ncbi:HD domain-containing protein [Thermanaeromonas toyohensis ToBE]|uniref:Stage 0 sporulation protein A homolog n=1 Tax=Thermanaeromonas toyohensis ToBE TaxID=698762 RepID=A0A1W1V8T2_9FIRM|nr:HD domain-containing phosphohydrolase [Thermanaeromonas toyohensis]SMB89663.1 HD domain-containing protein [Thermanaeromonas toyohensis ToBE]